MRIRSLAASVPLLLVLVAGRAHALEDAGACHEPYGHPQSGPIPANLPGFVIELGNTDSSVIALYRVDPDGTETLVPATTETSTALDNALQIVPDEPLVLGAHYRIPLGRCPYRGSPWPSLEYDVVEPVETPVTITLRLSPLQRRTLDGRLLWYSFDATVDPAHVAWAELFDTQWWADTTTGRVDPVGRDLALFGSGGRLILVACPDAPANSFAIEPGEVTVFVHGDGLLGGSFDASAITTNVCADAVDVPVPTSPDAGPGEAGPAPLDAGTAMDGGSGETMAGGCSVARTRPRPIALVGALLALVLRRRARRRS